jgi:hypothetical protein
MFSAYLMDPEHGWVATHRLPLASAIQYCLDYRERYAGVVVAVVPDDMDPKPMLDFVAKL